MAANFIESTTLPEGEDFRPWRDATLTALKAKGVTFVRLSYQPDKPKRLYIEGWLAQPDDQGPHPWESGRTVWIVIEIAYDTIIGWHHELTKEAADALAERWRSTNAGKVEVRQVEVEA
jgi:hypothetical protein